MDIHEKDERSFTQLRDCFYGGYSMPQYCLDEGIKHPVFVSADVKRLWEIYVQFSYDGRIHPAFALENVEKSVNVGFSPACVLSGLQAKCVTDIDYARHDKVIMLTHREAADQIPTAKIISFQSLVSRLVQYVYAERPLYAYVYKHPKVKVVVINHPVLFKNDCSDYEKRILQADSIHELRKRLERRGEAVLETRYDQFGYSNQSLLETLNLTGAKKKMNGSTELIDSKSAVAGVEHGKRKTAYQPEKAERTIFVMGTCTYYGIGAPWDKTIESNLQRIFNEKGYNVRVENASQFYAGRYQDIFYNLEVLPVKDGDVVYICIQNLYARHLPFLDVSKIFVRPHNYGEVFADKVFHLNERGYKFLADKMFKDLVNHNFYEDYEYHLPESAGLHLYGIPGVLSGGADVQRNDTLRRELADYKEMLSQERFRIGSIVMNCNPFTLGHRYLVEEAAHQVDLLYIFVVEEDRSDFPFKDRFAMVKAGTADIANVKVIRSGKVVLSQQTFSGYFNKENLQGVDVDPSQDVELFASQIAPALGINVRFVGEEPEDTVTRQYNESMAKILPRHGIELKVMPRKQDDEGYISAGRVRRALRVGEMEVMKKLLPNTTYDYIQNVKTGVALRERLLSRGTLLVESHQAYVGWHEAVFEGTSSGDTTKAWALEAVRLHFSSSVGKLSYRVFGADYKWEQLTGEGEVAGSVGKARPIYGIAIGLESEKFHVKYRVHVIGYGWSQWAMDGAGLMSKYPINGLNVIVE